MRSMQTRSGPMLALLFVAGALLTSATAFANGAKGIVVAVGGDADQVTRQHLATVVEQGLRDRREETRQVSDGATVDALIKCVQKEASKECAAEFMQTTAATRAVVMRVARDGQGKTQTVTLTAWLVAQEGSMLVIDHGVCETCTAAKLDETSQWLLNSLIKEGEARTSKTVIAVHTKPQGASVEIDGRIVGASNLEHGVYSGPHRIVVALNGYESAVRNIDVVAGETKTLDLELTPVAPDGNTAGSGAKITDPPTHSTVGPWITIGAGAAVTATGIVLLVNHDSEPSTGAVYYERRGAPVLGAVTTGLGVAAIGAGVWWLLHDRDRDGASARAPAVHVEPDRVVFVYGGAF